MKLQEIANRISEKHYPNKPNIIIDEPYRDVRMKALKQQVLEELENHMLELSQENLEMKKQNTELAKVLRKSVRIVKQMDDHTKKCIDNI